MKLNFFRTNAALILTTLILLVAASPAQTFTTLLNFDYTNGATPYAGLVQATNGNLYGTTGYGGANWRGCEGDAGCGTVFKITPSGKLTTLYSFCSQSGCTDGQLPAATLIQATNGSFYGTTTGVYGTIFKITPSGTLTTLYSFCSQSGCTDGDQPWAGLVQATNGDLYGTTYLGGASDNGTVFKITPSGKLTTLYNFCSQSNCTDGANPLAGLIQATNGDLYGTTSGGGADGYGTIFRITPSGKLTTLYSFCSQSGCADGANPYYGALVQATNGNLYGTTYAGGTNRYGTIFEITPSGTLTTLYSFCQQSGCPDGKSPQAGLVQATDGNFYGTTYIGGAKDHGTIFKITSSGTLTTLYSFCSQSNCTDGFDTWPGLVQDTNGTFYGTTQNGGDSSSCPGRCGTVFSLSVGLGPFVETLPTSGKVGAAVKILGTNLTGATSVTFNGTAAVFKVVSKSLITTSVPTGATTGTVEVTTPKGTLKSNVVFRVTK